LMSKQSLDLILEIERIFESAQLKTNKIFV
jgi:hypothetical protein